MSAKCSIIVKGNGKSLDDATVRVGPVTKKVSEKGVAVFDLADRTYYGITISAPGYEKQVRQIYHGKGENTYIFNLRKKEEPKPELKPAYEECDKDKFGFTELVECKKEGGYLKVSGWTMSTGRSGKYKINPPTGWEFDPDKSDVRGPVGSHGGCPSCVMTLVHYRKKLEPEQGETTPKTVARTGIDDLILAAMVGAAVLALGMMFIRRG